MTDRRKITSPQNAKKSTGPKTPEGKAAAALNAMKFGVYSEVTLAGGEDEAEFLGFAKRMRTDLAPIGEVEQTLADRIISTAWRLRRIVGVEALTFDHEKHWPNVFSGYTGERMARLNRHEASLERSLHRNMHELQRRQAERRGDKIAPPQALDIIVDTDEAAMSEPVARSIAVASFGQNGLGTAAKINGANPGPETQ
jgi:hypothetical protein